MINTVVLARSVWTVFIIFLLRKEKNESQYYFLDNCTNVLQKEIIEIGLFDGPNKSIPLVFMPQHVYSQLRQTIYYVKDFIISASLVYFSPACFCPNMGASFCPPANRVAGCVHPSNGMGLGQAPVFSEEDKAGC